MLKDSIKKIKLDFYDENGHFQNLIAYKSFGFLVIENKIFESSSKFIWVTTNQIVHITYV